MSSFSFRKTIPVSQIVSARKGFTLVELVVVVLVLGIVAAVAAPKMFDTASDARESGTAQSHQVVQEAIELYKAKNGAYPSGDEAAFKAALKDYIRGDFPKNQSGDSANADKVTIVTAGTPLAADGTGGWKYDSTTGEFIIN